MTPIQIIFIIAALVLLGSAIMVVTTKNLVHAAMYLVLTLLGVAVMFVLLEAGFFAVVQVVVYIGAIAILMLFVVMLTRDVMKPAVVKPFNNNVWLGIIIASLVLVAFVFMLSSSSLFGATAPELAADADHIVQLGTELVNPEGYMIPFEVASVLLLAAMIGSIYIAWRKQE